MKWLLILALGVLGCGDEAPPTFSGGGTVPPGKMPGTGGSGGGGGGGGLGGGGGDPKGACDNASDLGAIESAGDGVRNIARDCGRSFDCAASIGNSGSYGNCVSNCVENRVAGLSAECATCYGDLEGCGLVAFCRPQCQTNTCSTLCIDCLNGAGCITSFEECRGLPGDGCPG